jgi:hypothetical protein
MRQRSQGQFSHLAQFQQRLQCNPSTLAAKINVVGVVFAMGSQLQITLGCDIDPDLTRTRQFTNAPAFRRAVPGEPHPRDCWLHIDYFTTLLSILRLADKQCTYGPRTQRTGANALPVAFQLAQAFHA